MDYYVLSQPPIKAKFQQKTQQMIKEVEATIAFAISAGNMNPEPYEGIYHSLAFNTWMVSFFWINQQTIIDKIGDDSSNQGEMKIWSMLLPHLTPKGLKAFRNFFGEDYLKEMGRSFNADIGSYVKF